MAIQTIGYANKVTLNENTDVADVNKVKADDMNEIKSVVNANANLQGDLSDLNTADKSSLVAALNSINTYSTTEEVVGKWINDKPIYQKVLQVTTSSTLNTFNNIYDGSIEDIVSIDFQYKYSNTEKYPQNFQDFKFYVKDGILKEYHTDSYYSGHELTITLKYTKTTD